MGARLMGSDPACSRSLRSHSPGLWQRWPHWLSHWFAPDGFTLGWWLGDLMGVRHKERTCPARRPLPCHSIPALGALESCYKRLKPSQLLTREPWASGAVLVYLSCCCLHKSFIHGAWPGGILGTKSPQIQSHPTQETSSRQELRVASASRTGASLCQPSLPRVQEALQDCQDAHRLPRQRLCHHGPCPTNKHLQLIWESRTMAHPCSQDQGVFRLAMDDRGTVADAGLSTDAAPLPGVP